MSRTDALEVQLEEGRCVSMNLRRRAHHVSLHTGRQLTELHGWVETTEPDTHRWLSTTLRSVGERVIRTLNVHGEATARWQLSWNSYDESDGHHTYGLILREAEELTLEALMIDTMELHPYEYREEVIEDGLTIWAKVVGTQSDVTRINRLIRTRTSFPVVRRGIQKDPREMRLGVAEWSEYEDRIKYRLVLMDHEVGEGVRAEVVRIREQNKRAALGYYANLVDRLAELLVDRGVVERAELETIREAARAEPGVARHEVWRVADVDLL
jgi:hypothetical protein